jgi:hypothetical protein
MPPTSERSKLRRLWERALNAIFLARFPGSARYWDLRYRMGGTSGAGSYGRDKAYKAAYLNRLFVERKIRSVIDFGFGDGSQLAELRIDDYLGFDVSRAAVDRCRAHFADDPGKQFRLVGEYNGERADASMSLDVLYHLVEDEVFDAYLARLFQAANRWVVIYSTNAEDDRKLRGRHVRDREFTRSVAERFPDFKLADAPPRPEDLDGAGTEGASFFVFERASGKTT